MIKGFQDSARSSMFKGFPNLNFQMSNSAYGFSGCTFWIDAAYGLNTQTNLAPVSKWVDRIKGISFEQETAAYQPRLVVADSFFNNFPSIQRQNNVRYLRTLNSVPLGQSFTLAYVGKADTNNGRNDALSGDGIAASSGVLEMTPIEANGSNSTVITTSDNNTNPHIIIITNNRILVDTVETTGTLQSAVSIDSIGINGTVNNDIGRTAEIIIFGTALSLSDCIVLSDRLNQKYAIY